jgi:plastocyanin
VLLAGCGGGGGGPSDGGGPRTVAIKDFKFAPERIEVAKGTRITWTNGDRAPHTATAVSDAQRGSFDTQVIRQGKSAPVAFDRSGTYAYHCDLHPFMKATVVVR